jgi:hypothetical protein
MRTIPGNRGHAESVSLYPVAPDAHTCAGVVVRVRAEFRERGAVLEPRGAGDRAGQSEVLRQVDLAGFLFGDGNKVCEWHGSYGIFWRSAKRRALGGRFGKRDGDPRVLGDGLHCLRHDGVEVIDNPVLPTVNRDTGARPTVE